ncbi:hypothetical protein ACFXDH_43340 [Streptomyces sp. NPDC059467]|uniref:hypothetical protein n=1 Tax=Streptomyces sp. NPDC059467 TaxID=3346844 RepID=UPI0036A7829A
MYRLARLWCIVIRGGRRAVGIVCLVTGAGARAAWPVVWAVWVQSRWEIGNRLHWVWGVVFGGDRSGIRTGVVPSVSWRACVTP